MVFFLNITLFVLIIATVVLIRAVGKGREGARKAVIVCLCLTLMLSILKMAPMGGADAMAPVRQNHEQYQQVCGTFIGEQLAVSHPGARVVILTAPQWDNPPEAIRHTVLVEHLKSSLENRGLQVTLHPLDIPRELLPFSLGDDAMAMAREFLMQDTASWFNSEHLASVLAEWAPRADLLVSTVDVAGNLGPESLPSAQRGPGLILLNTQVEDIQAVLKQSVLHAVVLPRTDPGAWKPGTPIPEDTETAFNGHFLWVTQETADVFRAQGLMP